MNTSRLRTLIIGALLTLCSAVPALSLADDLEIYQNSSANPLTPPTTVLVLDLNLLGICNNVLLSGSDPENPELCLNVSSDMLLGELLGGLTEDPAGLLSSLLLGTGGSNADRARALCNLYGILGIDSPLVQLPLVGGLLGILLGGVSALTCGTLEFLLGIPLLSAILNGLLGGFVGQLVAGLLDPLLTTTVGQLPGAVTGLLNSTISGVLNLGQVGLVGLLESILNNLINTRVAIMLSHGDRATFGGAPAEDCAFGEQASIPTTRRQTPNCSNGAYFVLGMTDLVDQGTVNQVLTRVITLLTNTLSPSNVLNAVTAIAGAALTTPTRLLPPFQGKEVYAELTHYLAGDEVYNGPLNRWDGLTGLITRDTAIEAGGRYVAPNVTCDVVNVINVQLSNSMLDSESDDTLAAYYPGAGANPDFTDIVREAQETGFSAGGQQIKLNSYFVVQDNLSSLGSLTGAGLNVLNYVDSLGLLGMGQTIAELVVPTLEVNASLLTPSTTLDLTAPNRLLPPVYFPLFRPAADQLPRWDGNLKRLELIDGVYRDTRGDDAVDADGRLTETALTGWTNPATLGTATGDGDEVRLGGAGSRIPPSGRSNTDTGARKILFDRVVGGSLVMSNFNAGDGTLRTALRPVLGAASDSETQALMLYARGFEVGTTAAPVANLATVTQRPWRHGAVLHSQPVVINYGARGGHTAAQPDIRILYGAADGFLRLVRDRLPDGTLSGDESWAFLPQAVMSQQKVLRDNSAGRPFPYGVDGSPTLIIQDRDGNGGAGDGVIDDADDRIWAFVGLRRGGKGLYGLNLTNPDAPSLLWRISPSGLTSNTSVIGQPANAYAELGLTFSQPQAARLRIDGQDRIVLIFGGGYDGGRNAANTRLNKDAEAASDNVLGTDDTAGNALFIIDAESGALLWKATRGALDVSAPYTAAERRFRHPLLQDSIAADVELADLDGDGYVDRLYVGDTGGRLWRADFSGDDRADWTFGPVASVGRHDTANVANDRRLFHAVDIVPVRTSSEAYDAVVFATGNRADPLERVTANTLYVFRDSNTLSGVDAEDIAVDEGALPGHLDFADLTVACADASAVTCTDGADLDTGWRIQLSDAGEKGFAQPLTLGGTIFLSTYIPPDPNLPSCSPSEGGGKVYAVSLTDSRPVASSVLGAVDGNNGGAVRARPARAPGLPGDLSMADVGTARTGAEVLNVDMPRFFPIYWRERRGEDERPVPQPTPTP